MWSLSYLLELYAWWILYTLIMELQIQKLSNNQLLRTYLYYRHYHLSYQRDGFPHHFRHLPRILGLRLRESSPGPRSTAPARSPPILSSSSLRCSASEDGPHDDDDDGHDDGQGGQQQQHDAPHGHDDGSRRPGRQRHDHDDDGHDDDEQQQGRQQEQQRLVV